MLYRVAHDDSARFPGALSASALPVVATDARFCY